MKRIPTGILLAIIFLATFICLTLAATVFFREFVRDQLVVPLLAAFHFLRQLFNSIGDNVIWIAFILVMYVWMLLSLPSLDRTIKISGSYLDKPSRAGRLRHWLHEVHALQSEKYITRYATIELKKLILNTIAFRQQCNLRQAEQWLDAPENQRQIPPEVRQLLHAELPNQTQPGSLWQTLKSLLLRYPSLPKTIERIDLEPILRFLEVQDGKEYKPERSANSPTD